MMKENKSLFAARHSVLLQLFLLISLSFSACQSNSSGEKNVSGFDPDKDYFPDKVSVDYSMGFDIEYRSHYKLLHLFRHYNDIVDTVSYVLLQRGTPVPEGHNDKPVIEIPVEKLVAVSTTQLGMFEKLDALDQLTGIETVKYVHSQQIKDRVEDNQIIEVAPAGTINVEVVLNAGAEVLMGVGYPNSTNETYQQLERSGIPVLLNSDWQERDLLGRAEWMKLLAALLNKEELVNERFGAMESEYFQVLEEVQGQIETAPLTITGIALGDAWHVAGGRSFAFNLLQLAKADYPWKADSTTGSIKLDFETVYEFGLKADYWVAPGSAKSMDEVLQRDSRYQDFKAFKEGNIYNIYGRYTEGGGNDYYESGVVNPHIVLKDILKIFHPELLPEHELVYHRRLQ